MTETNFKKSLRAFVRRMPFKPFQVELLSGDRCVVEHPEALVHGGGVAVYIDRKGDLRLFDFSTVTQLSDIAGRKSA